MFYSTKVEICDSPESTPLKTIYADFQPYSGTVNFDCGISLDISNRVFCDRKEEINKDSYFIIDGSYYKVIHIKVWSDYMEIFLYQCKRQVS